MRLKKNTSNVEIELLNFRAWIKEDYVNFASFMPIGNSLLFENVAQRAFEAFEELKVQGAFIMDIVTAHPQPHPQPHH